MALLKIQFIALSKLLLLVKSYLAIFVITSRQGNMVLQLIKLGCTTPWLNTFVLFVSTKQKLGATLMNTSRQITKITYINAMSVNITEDLKAILPCM